MYTETVPEHEKPSAPKVSLETARDGAALTIAGMQQWRFSKGGRHWDFDGVYTWNGAEWLKYIEPAGSFIHKWSAFGRRLEVMTDEPDRKVIRFLGESLLPVPYNFTVSFEVQAGVPFVKRTVDISFKDDFNATPDNLRLTLPAAHGERFLEGYIASFPADQSQTTAWGWEDMGWLMLDLHMSEDALGNVGLPAIVAVTHGTQRVKFVCLVEYSEANPIRHLVRNTERAAEIGPTSIKHHFENGSSARSVSYWHIQADAKAGIYDACRAAVEWYWRIVEPYPEALLREPRTEKVPSWEHAAGGLWSNLNDGQAYGESNGRRWFTNFRSLPDKRGYGASFGSALEICEGLLRFARWKKDPALIAVALKHTEPFKDFLMPDGMFPFGGASEDESHTTTPFKYFRIMERLYYVHKLSGKKEYRDCFEKAVTHTLEHMSFPDGHQPYGWTILDPVTGVRTGRYEPGARFAPLGDFENVGSGGGTARWAGVLWMAGDLLGGDRYRQECLRAVDFMNERIPYRLMTDQRLFGIRTHGIAWAVFVNTRAYELTGDEQYLTHGRRWLTQLMLHYCFRELHDPQRPDPRANANQKLCPKIRSQGFAYACSIERWCAGFEMMDSTRLMASLLQYTHHDTALKMLALARQNQLYALPEACETDPVYPTYIPYEFPFRRTDREQYGCAPVFALFMLFEAFSRPNDPRILAFCPTAVSGGYQEDHHTLVYYNPTARACAFRLGMRGLAAGRRYTLRDPAQPRAIATGTVTELAQVELSLQPGERRVLRVEAER